MGGLLAGVVGIVVAFFGLNGGPALAGSLVLVAVVAAAAVGWLRQAPEPRIALEIDRRLELGERVTTALELATSRSEHPLAERQIADALGHLSAVRPGAVYRPRVPRRVQALAMVGVALAISPWVVSWPSLPGIHSPASQVAQVSQTEAARLDNVASNLDTQKNPADQPIRAELATQLRQAADDLRSDGGKSQQASQDLQRAEQATSALAPRTGEDAALTLARISDALNNQSATKPVTQALDQQNVAQAAAALSQLASSLPTMSATQRQDLANALQAASNAAQGSDTNAAQQLQQAAQAAKNGDAPGAQQAAQALQQLGADSQAQSDVAQTQSELQSSQQAVAQAAQTDQPQLSSAANPAALSNGDQTTNQGAGQPGGQGQTGQGNQQGGQQGGGIGKGSADHLGAPNPFQGLAQREVTVATDQQSNSGSISASNQLQVGTGGQAQVDYRNVLPQYQKQALQAMEDNAVPSGMKQVVKGYFDSLAAH